MKKGSFLSDQRSMKSVAREQVVFTIRPMADAGVELLVAPGRMKAAGVQRSFAQGQMTVVRVQQPFALGRTVVARVQHSLAHGRTVVAGVQGSFAPGRHYFYSIFAIFSKKSLNDKIIAEYF